jgi:hypothetical protein
MKMILKGSIILLYVWLWQGRSAGQIPGAQLFRITNSLSFKIKQLVPDAVVIVTNNVLEVKHATRVGNVHRYTGEIVPEDTEHALRRHVPDPTGFFIMARIGNGSPEEKEPLSRTVLPDFQKGESTRRLTFFETDTITKLPDADRYVVIDASFGEAADVQSFSNIFNLVKIALQISRGTNEPNLPSDGRRYS